VLRMTRKKSSFFPAKTSLTRWPSITSRFWKTSSRTGNRSRRPAESGETWGRLGAIGASTRSPEDGRLFSCPVPRAGPSDFELRDRACFSDSNFPSAGPRCAPPGWHPKRTRSERRYPRRRMNPGGGRSRLKP